MVEVFRLPNGHTEQSGRVILLHLQSFLKEVAGFTGIVALQQQPAPAHLVLRIIRVAGCKGAEHIVGIFVPVRLPQRFGLLQGLRRQDGTRRKGHQSRGREAAEGIHLAFHLSRASWVLASSTSSVASCFLYSCSGKAALSYFSLSMA